MWIIPEIIGKERNAKIKRGNRRKERGDKEWMKRHKMKDCCKNKKKRLRQERENIKEW